MQKVESGPESKKKVPALAQLFQPPTNCNPSLDDTSEQRLSRKDDAIFTKKAKTLTTAASRSEFWNTIYGHEFCENEISSTLTHLDPCQPPL